MLTVAMHEAARPRSKRDPISAARLSRYSPAVPVTANATQATIRTALAPMRSISTPVTGAPITMVRPTIVASSLISRLSFGVRANAASILGNTGLRAPSVMATDTPPVSITVLIPQLMGAGCEGVCASACKADHLVGIEPLDRRIVIAQFLQQATRVRTEPFIGLPRFTRRFREFDHWGVPPVFAIGRAVEEGAAARRS